MKENFSGTTLKSRPNWKLATGDQRLEFSEMVFRKVQNFNGALNIHRNSDFSWILLYFTIEKFDFLLFQVSIGVHSLKRMLTEQCVPGNKHSKSALSCPEKPGSLSVL